MGKVAQLLGTLKRIASSLSSHGSAVAKWIGEKLWDWVAILFIVTAFWAFGGIMVGIAVAEPIPSAEELALAAFLFSLGTILLGLRICVAAWRTEELKSIAQRITITLFVTTIVVVATLVGDRYLVGKIPHLSIEESLLLPPSLHPPAPAVAKVRTLNVRDTGKLVLSKFESSWYEKPSGKRQWFVPGKPISYKCHLRRGWQIRPQ
jgi:hypothetical protein